MELKEEKIQMEKIIKVCTEESVYNDISQKIDELKSRNKASTSASSSTLSPLETDIKDSKNVDEKKRNDDIDRQVKLGEITPFDADAKKSNSGTFNSTTGLLDLEKYIKRQAEIGAKKKHLEKPKSEKIKSNNKRRLVERNKIETYNSKFKKKCISDIESGIFRNKELDSESDYVPSEEEPESDEENGLKLKKIRKSTILSGDSSRKAQIIDDGDESLYKKRVAQIEHSQIEEKKFKFLDKLFKVPRSIWKKLYDYQKVSIRWLWELHSRNLGGLLGDEMGLGKTVQIITFFAGLDSSELLSDGGRFRGLGPTLIICPATLLEQWVQHFHSWWPLFRVVTLHHSGTHRGGTEELLESLKSGGILLTSYSGVLKHADCLISFRWHYVVLDEGHKIRNPQAKVTKIVKKFTTPHRILLTGSPMQNSLKELWSLFDFILPGKLGTLDAFIEHCANPITRGGYTNASAIQEATALQIATMLKDAITPYMLRRTKIDVQHHINLPDKNEQVLFCSLTQEQIDMYKNYLISEEVSTILHNKVSLEGVKSRAKLLVALTALRKICNHPDLFLYSKNNDNDDSENSDGDLENENMFLEKFGCWKKSGKMTVVKSLLKIWSRQHHRVLLFTQSRQMLHILELLIQNEGYKYLRLDGSTPIGERQSTIKKFNEDVNMYFIFLATTRVGGLGINLTGADRVVIYDPDWNPATDLQARERAWRIGQDKNVTIYRLITVGTIEEKIYHRQIFKLLLSNKILEDPRQRRLFQTSDLTELFHFNEPIDGKTTESDRLLAHSKLNQEEIKKHYNETKRNRKEQKISALFEGEKISLLIGRRLGTCNSDQSNAALNSVADDDNYVLSKLFFKTQVNSAFQHEAVLSGLNVESKTQTPIERLAIETAQQSMDLVRQSRIWCKKPSWCPQ